MARVREWRAGAQGLLLEQGLAALEFFLKHLGASAEAGKLAAAALGRSQRAAGASRPALEEASTPLPHLPAWAVLIPAFRRFS